MPRSLTKALFGESYDPAADADYILELINTIVDTQLHEKEPELLKLVKDITQRRDAQTANKVWHSLVSKGDNSKISLWQNMRRHAVNDTRPDLWRGMSECDECDNDSDELMNEMESHLTELEVTADTIKTATNFIKGALAADDATEYMKKQGFEWAKQLVDDKGADFLNGLIKKFVTPRDAEKADDMGDVVQGNPDDFQAAWDDTRGGDAGGDGELVDDEEAPTETDVEKDQQLAAGHMAEAAVRWLEMAGLDGGRERNTLLNEIKKTL